MNSDQKKSITIFVISLFAVSSLGFIGFWTISDSLLSQKPLSIDTNLDENTESFQPIYDTYFDNPNTTVYPQHRFEYSPKMQSVKNGIFIDTEHNDGTQLSDDIYGILEPQLQNKNFTEPIYRTLYNFFTVNWQVLPKEEILIELQLIDNVYNNSFIIPGPVWDAIGNLYFYFRINPELENFLSVDEIIDTQGILTDEHNVSNFYGKLVAADSDYLYPHPESYYEFTEDDQVTENIEFEATTGGLRFFNDTMFTFYQSLLRAKVMIDSQEDDMSIITYLLEWLNSLINPSMEDYLVLVNDLTIAMWLEESDVIYAFFDQFDPDFALFLDFFGVDPTKGFESFIAFDPYAITQINGKVQLYIDMPQDNPNLPHIDRYKVQLWNYYTLDWNDVLIRENQAPMQIINTWLYDNFHIDQNCWQYCHTVYNDQNETDSFKWRVLVETTRNSGDNGDIKVRFGGIWSSFKSEYMECSWSASFTVDKPEINVLDLLSDPVFYFEYHTEGWQSPYEGFTISRPVFTLLEAIYGSIELFEEYNANFNNLINDLMNNGIESVYENLYEKYAVGIYSDSIVDPFYKIKNMPNRDERIAFGIDRMYVNYDTWVTIGVNGRFAKYDLDGQLRNPKIYIDKASMQYEYKTALNITSKTYIDTNNIDFAYSVFEIDVSENIINLELPIRQDYAFISNDFALVESPNFRNISSYWINSLKTDDISGEFLEEPLFDDNIIRFSMKIFFFEGIGIYKIWCKIPNYIENINVYHSSGDLYEMYENITVEDSTTYKIQLKEIFNYDGMNSSDFSGNLFMDAIGNSYNGKTKKSLPRKYGIQSTHTEVDENSSTIIKHNNFDIIYSHVYSDGLWGNIDYKFFWNDNSGWRFGWIPYYLLILRVSKAPPIISVVNPLDNERWGVFKPNYLTVTAWHSETSGVFAKFNGWNENISLIKLSDALENLSIDPNIEEFGIPQNLLQIPSTWQDYYWIYPIYGKTLEELYPNDGSGYSDINVKIWGESLVGQTTYISSNVSIDFKLIHDNNFEVLPVYDIEVGQKIRLRYYCPEGITTIKISLQDKTGLNTQLVILGNETKTMFLNEGFQTYTVPFRFTYASEFKIFVEVYDDLENYNIYTTNEFIVDETDSRSWYIRLLDEGAEIMILWTSFTGSALGLGVILIKRKKINNFSIVNGKAQKIDINKSSLIRRVK